MFDLSQRFLLVGMMFQCFVVNSIARSAEPSSKTSPVADVDFNRDIRPILSKNCFHCHGPDEGTREADLRLDQRTSATAKLDSDHRAIVPGNVAESELYRRIISTDESEVMPPPDVGEKLTASQIALVKKWIEHEAPYARHWSFVPPKQPKRPTVNLTDWPANEIDYFILSQQEAAGIKPSPQADRYTLIRRLSFDLRGLPPTLDEVDQFLKDTSPDAYEKLVDRFLEDTAYGERWARKWLDLARYADSKGYGSDPLRMDIWRYRDWVISAFNQNMPFDQFTLEQLAGDLLPNATLEQKVATAFHRNTMTNTEGGTDDEEFRTAAVTDRVDTTIQVWMGLTMGCAKCHTHKYDPISQKEYYQLYAFFNQTADNDQPTDAPTIAAPTPTMLEATKRIDAAIVALNKKIQTPTKELELAQQKWESTLHAKPKWNILTPLSAKSTSATTKFQIQKDGSVLANGPAAKEKYIIKTELDPSTFKGLRLEAISDDRLPANGPGRAKDGNFVLSNIKLETQPLKIDDAPAKGQFLRIEHQGTKKQILSLAEVQVFQADTNIASQGTASQSSTTHSAPAKLAIDGKTDGHFFNAKSTTHTKTEVKPWWELKLKAETSIDRITIWNRSDGAQERLANFKVSVLDAKRNVVWQSIVEAYPKPSTTLAVSRRKTIPLKRTFASFSQNGFPVNAAIDLANKNKKGWGIAPQFGKTHAAYFIPEASPTAKAGKQRLIVTLSHSFNDPQYALGRFRISSTTEAKLEPRLKVPNDILAIVDTKPEDRQPAQQKKLATYYRSISPALKSTRDQIAKLQKSKPVYPQLPIMQELPTDKQRETRIMVRGSFLSPGDVVKPAVLSAFNPLPENVPTNRIAVAKWLTSPENPLTARVAVNRFWSELFGAGLVVTEEDFGTQGELPSHPELLDWLATEFVQNGWDMKAILKTIVMSSTYRQSSTTKPIHIQKDPRNRLLSRGPRFRLEAEMIRDQALQLSGLLNRKIGGPSVYPVQPEGIWRAAFNGQRNWATNKDENRFRRGLYTFWRRTVPYPSMATFDAPSREICTIRRISTNTPLQAMITLNDPVFIEISQALGLRIFREGGDSPESRIKYGLKLCLIRPALSEQIAPLLKLYESELKYYQSHPEEAANLVENSLNPLPDQYNKSELAAWTVIANVLLNLDGVLTKG
ncbi:DUF1553 domain-containing protein [Gimesia aquarii]|uniref:Planctomycete cytochrome C n=1 Tax=Gimesia aquarii TaxID=2527964 RepID=A0A517WYV4_9PLAN|nr:DUF1553 domain-containing protein [Gimesia aquarii]QDU10440.1 Planctomycete cytochrome C [Gimesia aquarii]